MFKNMYDSCKENINETNKHKITYTKLFYSYKVQKQTKIIIKAVGSDQKHT